ncbi:MAG: hypothetical protein K2N23_06090 [Clostridia bacterium]|nr:hypothetical protein [Clostridia bacterium]
MKKIFSAILTAALVAITAIAFVGCGNKPTNDDTENRAKDAIKILKGNYLDKFAGTESPEDYEVFGVVKTKDVTPYPVTWTVTSDAFNNLQDYVQVGAMDESSKLVTVSVTRAEQAIAYTLTASVTVGSKTESVSFDRIVPAKPAQISMHQGTQEDPFTAANVIEIGNAIAGSEKDNYYMEEDGVTPKQVYVTGYIVDCGTDQTSKGYNRVGFVYIVDEYSEDKTSKSEGALMILSINYDESNLTCYGDLKKGAKITVKGYIEKYIKNSTTAPQPEVTYYKGNGITCEALENV